MRKSMLFNLVFVLAGSTHSVASDHSTSNDFGYDERDAIESDSLQQTGPHPVTGVKKLLVTVVHWQDGDALKDSLIEQHTVSRDPDSLRSYILAASHGKLTLDGTMITSTSGRRPDICKSGSPMPFGLAREEGDKAARAKGIDPDSFDYLINVIDCGGNAAASTPGRLIGVYGQSGGPHVYKHEFGHNLGYSHGNTYTKCPKDQNTVKSPTECTASGFGDTGDTVSGGGTLYPANNRWFSGWLDSSQASVITATGLYRLGVLGQKGPQLYLINRSNLTPAQLALEYRKPTPFDNFPPGDNRVNGVWVRYTTMGGSVRNTQLDATPETSSTDDPALLPGKLLEDVTARVKIAVCSTDETGAIVAVAVNGQNLPYCTTTVPAPVIAAPETNAKTGRRPVIAGTAWPGSRIVVSEAKKPASKPVETITDAQGKWSLQYPENLPLGRQTITAQQFFGPKHSVLAIERSFEVTDIAVSPALIQTPDKNVRTGRHPTVTGTGIPGATVVLLRTNNPQASLATTVVDGYGKWSVQIDKPLPAGPYSLSGYQIIDGKKSAWIANHPIQVVDVPEPAHILTPQKNVQTGQRPVVTGTGIAGATVTLLKTNDPDTALATTVVDGYGKWSVQIDKPLPTGPYSLSGYQLVDGKKSAWIANHPIQVVDVPEPAQILTPEKKVQTGQRPIVTGIGIAGATVVLLRTNNPNASLATTVVDGYGKWSVQIDKPLPTGPYSLSGYQLVDGKKSAWIANHPIQVVDVPEPAQILTPEKKVQTGQRPVVTGIGIAGATVVLLRTNNPDASLAKTVVDGYGKWSVQIDKPLPTGPYSLSGYQLVDGKKSAWIANHPIQVVDVPEPAQILTPEKNTQTVPRPIVTGTGIAGATVTLLKTNDPDTALATTVVDGYGKWSVQIDKPLPTGPFSLSGYQLIDGKKSGWIANHPIQVVDPAP